MDPAGLAPADVIYLQNTNLQRNFKLTVGGIPYSVGAAVLDDTDDMLYLTVADPNADLSENVGNSELRPRYFGITTLGIEGSLPSSSSVKIEVEVAEADANDPSAPSATQTTGFVTDIENVNFGGLGMDATALRFMRYRVTFDITQGTAPLDFSTPRPQMDFLRVPYTF